MFFWRLASRKSAEGQRWKVTTHSCWLVWEVQRSLSDLAALRVKETFMSDVGRSAHWENVYKTKGEREVSWFQQNPTPSLDLIASTGVSARAAIIDIGGGASRLVDALVERQTGQITILDLSKMALDAAKARLGNKAANVRWEVADVTKWDPAQAYEL